MKKIYAVLLILSFYSVTKVHAQWISTGNNNCDTQTPDVELISDDEFQTTIKIEINGFKIKEFVSGEKSYQTIDLLNEIYTNDAGFPQVPHIAKILAIPNEASVSVEILNTSEAQIFHNIYLPPVRESWYEGHTETDFIENTSAYNSQKAYPENYANIESPSVFRDFRIARLSVYPIKYIAAKQELHVYTSITVKVNYGSGISENIKSTDKKPIPPSFGNIYRKTIFNYESVLNREYDGKESGHDLMLCIMDDIFETSFSYYAAWKKQSGIDIHMTTFSEINANSTNPEIIKNHITDAYHNWEIPPSYVLIVGDDGIFPTKTITYPDYSFANEDYFVEIDGNDHFPEMMIGRFTNQGDYRMRVMINKYYQYEKNPYVADTSWFKQAICCSNNDYESQVYTKRFTAELMINDGGFTNVDTMMSDGTGWGGNCTYDEQDVLNVLNSGRSYLNYRGEGWSSGWYANCYDFGTSDLSNLNNGEMLTFVTSIGCGVAMFDTYGGNCFGEEWIQMGTLTDIRGGVAFIGPVSNTHTTYNNKIDKGIYVGMFQEGMDTPGQALLRGKLYLYNVYGTDSWVEYHYRVFCTLGDPSIHIWKDVPKDINVNHPQEIFLGTSNQEITVIHSLSGLPVDSAQVCISSDSVFATAYTDSLGKAFVTISPQYEDTLTITVRGRTVIPYQDTILATQILEQVVIEGAPEITDIDGNTDGKINPNENCEITFTLKNYGIQTAENVKATLSSADTNVTIITTSEINFGNIAASAQATGTPFQFFVKENCPINHHIILNLHIESNLHTWDYTVNEEVFGCNLNYVDFIVDDESSVLPNFRLDPGETAKIYISIENFGDDFGQNVKGILSSQDQYITINDSLGSFGTIDIGNSSLNNSDFFEVSVDNSCPGHYMVNYTLTLYTENSYYPYEKTINIEIPVDMPKVSDYTGPDNYGYYAYSIDDKLFEQAPEYEWFEIRTLGTRLNAGVLGDYTETATLPFTFKYYGIDYNQVRISTDGWIAFGTGNETQLSNDSLPINDNINNMVAVFWDDLYDNQYEEGSVYYYYDNANNRFVVEWDSIAHWNDEQSPKKEKFQVFLNNPQFYTTPTGDGDIICQYKNVFDGSSCTVGIENDMQSIGLNYLFNTKHDSTASAIRDQFAIKFTTTPPGIALGDENTHETFSSQGIKLQNQPNPFSEFTYIKYELSKSCQLSINIFDINGQKIKSLVNKNHMSGTHTVKWDGTNSNGLKVNSGIYFVRLVSDYEVLSQKIFLLK